MDGGPFVRAGLGFTDEVPDRVVDDAARLAGIPAVDLSPYGREIAPEAVHLRRLGRCA
ncbi:hypothetical protein [Streptomyces sp. NPDC059881]|uniref:hypothetical protein n=1 Tax=Streptomyces sp. NPDC059881 TaxID=3346986 RepID=UPI00365F9450